MSLVVPVSSDLDVTLLDDGTLRWAPGVSREHVEQEIQRAIQRHGERIGRLQRCLAALLAQPIKGGNP